MVREIRFSITPFLNTRQFYYALETGAVTPDGVDVTVEKNHSPVKDQKILCGEVDATTMSMGKYVLSKLVSHTDVVPTDPLAAAAGLTYHEGNGLFVRTDGDIENPADLRGKRLGVHDTTMAMTYHKAILDDGFGVPVDEIEWVVDTHQGLAERAERGDVDAVERVNDFYWSLRANPEYEMLYDMGEAWHDLHGYHPLVHLIAVDRAVYDDDPDAVESFLDVLGRSRDYRDDHYDDIVAAFLEEGAGEADDDLTEEDVRTLTTGTRCPFVLGDDQRRNVLDWMGYAVRYGVFPEVPIPETRLFP